jgi:hypothetical protein
MRKSLPTKGLFFTVLALTASSNGYSDNSPYLAKVYDFMPAPGQFVNVIPEYENGDTKDDILLKLEENLCGDKTPGLISLGNYGGYIVFGFDHSVVNVEGEYDFIIYGNSTVSSLEDNQGSSEPGIVMVSTDTNGNGLPDDEWYELAGSEYSKESTLHNYTITYYKPTKGATPNPDPDYSYITDRNYIRFTTNDPEQAEGYVMQNSFHEQSYWPEWISDESISFSGTKLADTGVDTSGNGSYYVHTILDYGYVDNKPNDSDPGFKIDWAVDAEGNHVSLTHIDFIKVFTATNQNCGWLGESSTEISGGEDLHPDTVYDPDAGVANISAASAGIATVYSIAGNVVISSDADSLNDKLSQLPSGIYIVRTSSSTKKIIR